MINVEITKRYGEMDIYTVGHALYAKDGEPDIVCAAVSAIMQTAALGLKTLAEQYPDNVNVKIIEK